MLGSMLVSPQDTIAQCVERINEAHFYVPAHRTIYQVIVDLWDSREAIDLITVTERLRDQNLLDSVGGAAFVTHLFSFVPTAVNVAYYLDIVRDKYLLRSIITAATECARQAQDHQADAGGVLSFATENFERLHGLNGSGDISMQDGAALLGEPIVLPPDVIDGVVHRGGKLVLGGASKSYKTWLLIDLSVSVATGAEWFNGFATKKGRVLYVNFELPAAYFTRRTATVCNERQLTIETGMLSIWNLRGHVMEWARLQRQISPDKFDLVVIDPIYKLLLGRDENKAGDIATLLLEMEVLAMRTGAAVAFGAHYSKGNQSQKESIDRIGGSGVFARDPDSILVFTKHEETDCFSVEMTLRNHPPREPFVVRWQYPLFTVESMLDPKQLKQAGRKPDDSLKAEKFLELLSEPMPAADWLKLCADELGASRATFYRRKDELEKAKKIRKDAAGKWSQVSEVSE